MKTPDKFKYIAKIAPKELFHKPQILPSGFSINNCTVLFDFKSERMNITFFEDGGKMECKNLNIPDNKKALLQKMKMICGNFDYTISNSR